MGTFGTRDNDSPKDSAGNVLADLKQTFYASRADAEAQTNPLGSATTGKDGRFTFSADGKISAFGRDPFGVIRPYDTEDIGTAANSTFARVATGAVVKNWPSPFYIAHRGGPLIAPEESMTALRSSAAYGANGMEIDLQVLADGSLACMHDATVDRTTTSTGNVNKFTAGTWQKLQINTAALIGGSGWPVEAPPLAEQVFREFGNRVAIVPQVDTLDVLTKLDTLLGRIGINKETVLVQSFVQAVVLQAASMGYPTMKLGNTTADFNLPTLASGGVMHVSIAQAGYPGTTFAADAKALGLKTSVFVASKQYEKDKALAAGFDGMWTDDPAYLASLSTVQRTTDAFLTGARFPGHHATQGNFGVFTGTNEYGYDATASTNAASILGYLAPPDPTNFTLTFDMNLVTDNGVTTAGGQVWLMNEDYCTNDYRTTQDGIALTDDGYRMDIRSNNTLGAVKLLNNQTPTNLNPNIAVTGMALNTWRTYKVIVTPTTIRFECTTTGEGQTFTDATYRPLKYIGVGKQGSGAQVKFRNVTVS